MRVAILTTDNRQHYRTYDSTVPIFGTAPEALLQGMAQIPGLEAHVVCCSQKPLKSPAKLADNIYYHGLHVGKIGWMRTAYTGCIRATRKKLEEIKPDIVHGQGTERDCAISAVFSGFPSALTIHGNMRLIARVNKAKPFSFVWLAAKLEAATIPRAGGVVCITTYTRDAVSDLARKTWVVPNAVDASFFDVKRAMATQGPPVILCVGNVSLRKNQNAYIRALDALAEKVKFRLVFLGLTEKGNPYDDEFNSLVASRPWCEYGGFADRPKLKALLSGAAALALPSLEDNCPMVVLESMAAGVPVMAAKVGGVPDLVDDGRTGVFCDPLNAGSMRDATARVLLDSALTEKLVETAKTEAIKRFHPKAIAERHVEIYKEILGRK